MYSIEYTWSVDLKKIYFEIKTRQNYQYCINSDLYHIDYLFVYRRIIVHLF